MSLNCSDRATKEDLYGLLFSPEILICSLACEDFSSKCLSRQMATRALCSKKGSRQTASLSPWRIKGVCHSAPLSIDCFLLSCFFFSSLDGRKEGKRRSRRLRPPAKFAICVMVYVITFIENTFFVFTCSFFTFINAICKGDG